MAAPHAAKSGAGPVGSGEMSVSSSIQTKPSLFRIGAPESPALAKPREPAIPLPHQYSLASRLEVFSQTGSVMVKHLSCLMTRFFTRERFGRPQFLAGALAPGFPGAGILAGSFRVDAHPKPPASPRMSASTQDGFNFTAAASPVRLSPISPSDFLSSFPNPKVTTPNTPHFSTW